MPKQRQKEQIAGRHFRWLLGLRNGVFFADGRSNAVGLGRHSLGTRDRAEALRQLAELDLTKAVEQGLADAAALQRAHATPLSLDEGRRLYLAHAGRPRVTGGVRKSSLKRYRTVFDKFGLFAAGRGLTHWSQVKTGTLLDYAGHLDAESYAYRTVYVELTTLKQAVGWLIGAGHLPAGCKIELPLKKSDGTDTYCWTAAEVRAILDRCRSVSDLAWLGDALLALALTGVRISELAGLRWGDVDLVGGMIRLTDETSRAGSNVLTARTVKSGRGRVFPIHDELRGVLEALPRQADGRVFHGPLGGKLKPDTVRRTLIAAVLEPLRDRFPTPVGDRGFPDGRLHSFRHFFCSLCANEGVPQQTVMSWLGHRDSAMVRHYFHLHDGEARRQMRRITLGTDDTPGPMKQTD